jgi:hypothetical protein
MSDLTERIGHLSILYGPKISSGEPKHFRDFKERFEILEFDQSSCGNYRVRELCFPITIAVTTTNSARINSCGGYVEYKWRCLDASTAAKLKFTAY